MNCLQQFFAMAKASVKLHSIQLQQPERYDFFVTSGSLVECVFRPENLTESRGYVQTTVDTNYFLYYILHFRL